MTDEASAPSRRASGPTTRTKARREAVDLLFESEQRAVNVIELLEQRMAEPVREVPPRAYAAQLVRGVAANWHSINEALTTYAKGWSLERMPSVDRAVLRLGAYEVIYEDDVPDGAAISEAVALARDLSTDESPTFINGLLSRLSEVKTTLV
ncbi:transcription antitermination factor NusB [Demetria terragena]|uniref:transcription antitermination factor NusB n=1 Tax=Demetria terragena TaxID=63959 RepID=UPI000369DB45|nr:transcription antitermination factor NusB [Demetria terragena]